MLKYPVMKDSFKNFGQQLVELRVQAGYSSLDKALIALKQRRTKITLSKSLLSLYERGQIKALRPEILRALAALYGVEYEYLATCWFEARYLQRLPQISERKIFLDSIVSVEDMTKEQSSLRKDSQVGVCAMSFVDDRMFYDLVRNNLARGIKYTYLIPEYTRSAFNAFVSKLRSDSKVAPYLSSGNLQFISRPMLDIPVSFVIHLPTDGTPQGFIALPVGDGPRVYQRTNFEVSWRLVESFAWITVLSRDNELRARLFNIQAKFDSQRQKRSQSGLN